MPLDDAAHLRPMRVEGVLCVHHEDNHLLARGRRAGRRVFIARRGRRQRYPEKPREGEPAGGNHGTVDDCPPVPFVRGLLRSHGCMRRRVG